MGYGMTRQKDQVTDNCRFKRVLVTGASGFLGKPLVWELTVRGYQTTALGLHQKHSPFGSGVEYTTGDLANTKSASKLLRPWRWDAVINLAGTVPKSNACLSNEYRILSQHINIALNVCHAIPTSWPGRIIHLSSMTVYGLPEQLPVEESHPRKPIDAYGAVKACAEDVVFAFSENMQLDSWVLRLPGLFSETRQNGALFNFMRAAVKGHPIVITSTRPIPWDVLHVSDAVEAIARALQANIRNPGAINIGYGSPVELNAMAKQIAACAGSPLPVHNTGGVKHPVFQMDIRKARHLLDWPPTTLQARLNNMWKALAHGQRSQVLAQ